MDWYERLVSARPVILRNWNLPTTISGPELSVMADALHTDEAGYKNSVNLCRFCKCLYATAKMEAEGKAECGETEEFHKFYQLLYTTVEMFLTDVPCLKTSPHTSETLLYCLGFLVDLANLALASLDTSTSPQRVRDANYIVRALCKALDRDTSFHQMHEYIPLPSALIDGPRRYVTCRSFPTSADAFFSPAKRRKVVSGAPVNMSSFCRCFECGLRSPESHLWIKSLVEYFGRGCPGHGPNTGGFENVKTLLSRLHNFPIELTETVLHLFSRMTEYLRDDLRSNLLHPFMKFMKGLTARCERELDDDDEQRIEVYVMVLKHVRCLLSFFLPGEVGQTIVSDLESQIQRKLLSFMSAENDTLSESSPGSLMVHVCEEVSSAKSIPPARRILQRTAEWFNFKFPLRLHFGRIHQDRIQYSSSS